MPTTGPAPLSLTREGNALKTSINPMEEITTFGKWKEVYIANLIREAGNERGENALTAAANLDKKERYKARKWLTEQLTKDTADSSPIDEITHAIEATAAAATSE